MNRPQFTDAALRAALDHQAELLRELRADQRALLALVGALVASQQCRRSKPPTINPDAATRLLVAMHARAGDALFSSSELCIDAAQPGREALREAILGAVGALNARKVGRLLRAIEGTDQGGGLCIVRCGRDRDGALWRVCEFPNSQTHIAHCDRASTGG